MGCLWASQFPEHQCHFLVKAGHGFLQQSHFCVQPGGQTIHFHASRPEDYHSQGDCIVIATKAYDALPALRSALQSVKNPQAIFLLQNGMGSQQEIADYYPDLALFAVSSTHGAYKADICTLVHAGVGIQRIGPLNTLANAALLNNLLPATLYNWHADIQTVLWQKLQINAAINALTVIYQCANGALLDGAEREQHMAGLCAETDHLLDALGILHQPSLPLARQVANSTANNYSSMYQDVKQQRRTEIDYINGYIVRTAQQLGLACPLHQNILQQAKTWPFIPVE